MTNKATIALGSACIVLVALVSVGVYYHHSQIADLEDIVNLQKSQIADLEDIVNLQKSQIADLEDIVNLEKSIVWVDNKTVSQGASESTLWTFSPTYAGYVSVYLSYFGPVHTDSAIVEVTYESHGVNYASGKVWIKVGKTAKFPVLPTSSLTLTVGNGYWFNGATETVTITYTY